VVVCGIPEPVEVHKNYKKIYGSISKIKQFFRNLSNEDKKLCKQLGRNAATGQWNTEGGFTTSYATPQQIYNDTRFWISHPGDDLMDYLEGYEILDFNDNWNPPMSML
jgi:hypothetical protein